MLKWQKMQKQTFFRFAFFVSKSFFCIAFFARFKFSKGKLAWDYLSLLTDCCSAGYVAEDELIEVTPSKIRCAECQPFVGSVVAL